MRVLDRVGVEIKPGDFLIYVVGGDRHAVLEFGWVIKFHETKDSYTGKPSGRVKVKLQRAEPNGDRHTIEAIDVAGHYLPHTPEHIAKHRNPDGSWYSPTPQEREEFYVPTTYRDTGKPSTTMLDVYEGNNNRLMVTKPI